MRLLIAILLGILIGLSFRDTPSKGESLLVSSLMDKTVALVDGEHVFCAGVWISDKEILTAGHCVSDRDWVSYYNYRDFVTGNFAGGHLGMVKKTSSSDLALIQVILLDNQHGTAEIFSGDVVSGMEGHIIGHPGRQPYSYMRGWVSGIRWHRGAYYFQVQAPVFFGNSGGGMFDSKGRLIGISSSLGLMAPDVGYFVSHKEILEFLQESF